MPCDDTNPVQDLGFMYNHNLADPDGHLWRRCGWTRRRFPRAIRNRFQNIRRRPPMMTIHQDPSSINHATAKARRSAVALLVTTLYLQGGISRAAETGKSPAMPAAAPPPAGQYHLDK